VASDNTRVVDLSALPEYAAELASTLHAGDAVAFHGGLGAGKTTLVRAIVTALHGNGDGVSSPTFVFRHHYRGEPPVEHLDIFRLNDPAEAAELGLEEAFDARTLTLVEWPERLPGLLPPHAIHVEIAGLGDEPRRITVRRP
jgi:tRNA threonylcarbamoyladenosine biosynthesis protein TsaE